MNARVRAAGAGLFTQFGGYVDVLVHVARHLGALDNPQLRILLVRQIHAHGVQALPLLAVLAVLGGGSVIIGLAGLLGIDNDTAIRNGLLFLWLEFAPMLSALVMIARGSGGMAGDLALMRLHDEFAALEWLHIPHRDFLLLPRVLGAALAAMAATAWVQLLSLVGGMALAALVLGFKFADQLERTLDLAQATLIYAGIAKAACFGLFLAAVACHQGISARRARTEITRAGMSAVGQGMVYVVLLDALFGCLIYFILQSPT